jgi:asparagine synthase (glutamine-hydrolysing)
MCGIAGFIDRENGASICERASILERMCRVITHRGPDFQGMTIEGRVALGMRRLSIIDLAGGKQPITNEDGTISLVFNGEIYNYRELQPALESAGHNFRTRSDTEVIVHLFEDYGRQCPEHLRGMFAFAVWDSRNQELFLARDRAGKKPLCYTVTAGGVFVFGSELKCLLEHPGVAREINPQAIDAYLTLGYVPDPMTIYTGIHKLPPGWSLSYRRGKVQLAQYWDFKLREREQFAEDEALEQLRSMLDEAVRIRLVADVPLGAFLSGGVDSSAVVALMSQHTDRPVQTFSIGYKEDRYDELKYARIAASHIGTDHHELILTPDLCDLVEDLAWHFDEPFADSSAIPTYLVSKLARNYVKVVLTGDGGDELFAGYTRYAVHRERSKLSSLPRPIRNRIIRRLSYLMPHGAWGRNLLYNISLEPMSRYLNDVSLFGELTRPSLYSNDFADQLARENSAFKLPASFSSLEDRLASLLYMDSKLYLPGDILTKVDRMSMAVSLEARAPLLDHKLIELAGSIPAAFKMKGSGGKYIFKRAIEGLVPAEILRRPKQGFGVPVREWINEQLRDQFREVLTEPRTLQRGYMNAAYVRLLLDEHERGRRDHSQCLWALFMLELWHRRIHEATSAKAYSSAPDLRFVDERPPMRTNHATAGAPVSGTAGTIRRNLEA